MDQFVTNEEVGGVFRVLFLFIFGLMRKNRDEDEPTAERVCFAGGAANGTEENIDLLCNLLPRKSIWQHRKKQIEFHSRNQPSEFQSKFLNFKFDDSAQYKKLPIFD